MFYYSGHLIPTLETIYQKEVYAPTCQELSLTTDSIHFLIHRLMDEGERRIYSDVSSASAYSTIISGFHRNVFL